MREGVRTRISSPPVSAVFDVELDEVLGEFSVKGLVYFVEDEVEEVEAGDERRWKCELLAGSRCIWIPPDWLPQEWTCGR
jgi:hypothetical protein